MANPKKNSEAENPFAAFQLAQLAVRLAKNDTNPRLLFPEAERLLIAAKKYLIGDISSIIESVKSRAEMDFLMASIAAASVGWEKLLAMLDQAVLKRPKRANRVLTIKKVSAFLVRAFPASVIIIEKIDKTTQGKLFISQLDSGRLSWQDAQKIVTKWRSTRKKTTEDATAARIEKAAEKRNSKKSDSEY